MGECLKYDVRQNRRKAATRRSQRNRLIWINIILVFVLAAIIGLLISENHSNAIRELKQFQGTWKYDEYTQYEFDGSGNGCMCLENLHYEYTYTVKGNKLKLDFKDNVVRDCTYAFLIKDDSMTINGGEGTVGGTYKLHKQD